MKKYRTIEKIISPPPPHMVGDGFRVHNFFPSQTIHERRMSPFYLLDYNSKSIFRQAKHQEGLEFIRTGVLKQLPLPIMEKWPIMIVRATKA